CGNSLDGGAVGDIARLGLAADLLRQRLETSGSPGEQDAEVAAAGEQAGDLGADARGGARDDREPAHGGQAISGFSRIAPMAGPFEGKRGLVLGVANKRSIA